MTLTIAAIIFCLSVLMGIWTYSKNRRTHIHGYGILSILLFITSLAAGIYIICTLFLLQSIS